MSKTTFITAAALALTGTLGTSMAQAHGSDEVQWSVTIGSQVGTPMYGRQAPVYVEPARVYTRPAPVYLEPAVVYARPWHRDHGYRQPTRWDRDGDGIPNRLDPVYNPRWDRDGDGIPNRYDRHDNLRHDRDSDGGPNWRDHHRDGYGGR